MPCCGCRTSFGLSIANDAGYDEIRIIHRRSKCRSQCITQLASFMDGSWHARVEMAGETARPGKTPDELMQPGMVKRQFGVIFLQRALEIQVCQVRRRSMSRACDQEHIDIVAHNQSIKMRINQVDVMTRITVTQQSILYLLKLQEHLNQHVILKINLSGS